MGVHQELADQAALYVLGALTCADKSAFEAHLSVCVECTAEVRGFVRVAEALAEVTAEGSPAPAVRRALLTRITFST